MDFNPSPRTAELLRRIDAFMDEQVFPVEHLYREQVHASIGDELTVLVFIVVIIGGLGSVGGCFVGALLVGLTANYIGFLAPKVALGSNILLMALILLWRPQGLYPVARR